MVSVRALVVAAVAAAAAAVATVPDAAAATYKGQVCVTTTINCCYTPYVCDIIIKYESRSESYSCDYKTKKRVEVPCSYSSGSSYGGGYGKGSYRPSKCYESRNVLVAKTCYKDVSVAKYVPKVCYKESCKTQYKGSKPKGGLVGTGAYGPAVSKDPKGYFTKVLGY